jgi:hypothetical protein
MLILRAVPDLRLKSSWQHESGQGLNQSINFVLWYAEDAGTLIVVKIDVTAFGDYIGQVLGIDSATVENALRDHRDLIERLARQKYRGGNFGEVKLERSDFAIDLKDGT